MAYVKKLGKAIAKFKNDKKLIEFVNKLRPAPLEEMATLHAGYDEDKAKRLEGRRSKKSVIGVTMLDYSNGTGDKTISVMANLSPYVIKYLYDVVKNFPQTFDWKESKIIGYIKDEKGQSPCTSITIRRNPKNSDGQEMRSPWYIQVENGTGIADKTRTGGTNCRKGSYVATGSVALNLTDFEMHKICRAANDFIVAFERYTYSGLMNEMRALGLDFDESEGECA